MGFLRASKFRQQFIAGLLLAVFSVQAAQASRCCDMDMESTTEMTASENMPCHAHDVMDHDGECCLSCVSIVTAVRVTPGAAVMCESTVTIAIHFDLVSRPDLPYRPPTHHLS